MKNVLILAAGAAAAVVMAAAFGCGGASSTTASPTPTPTPVTTNTITITNNVASPQSITVTRGSQVTILNSDSRSHTMESDPHPEHTDCTELNQIGFLNPGQSKLSGNLNTAKKCGMHDHNAPDIAGLKVTITIQ